MVKYSVQTYLSKVYILAPCAVEKGSLCLSPRVLACLDVFSQIVWNLTAILIKSDFGAFQILNLHTERN